MLEGSNLLGTHLATELGVLRLLDVGQQVLLRLSALVVAILLGVHGELPQLLVVGTVLPAVLVHLLTEVVEGIGVERARVVGDEFAALCLGEFHNLWSQRTGHLATLAENHSPYGVVHHDIAALALFHGEQVEECDVLHILREWCHQWWIAHTRPNIFHLVEQGDKHVVGGELGLALLLAQVVDNALNATQVGHHRTHHTTGQATAEQQTRHLLVAGIDEVAQPVVDELLRQRAGLHVGLHVDIGNIEAFVAQHRLHGDYVGMHLTPRQGLDGSVDDVGTVLTNLQDRGHRQARTRVTVILDDDFRIFRLDHLCQLTQEGRLTDAGHVLQTDLLGTSGNHLVGDGHIII